MKKSNRYHLYKRKLRKIVVSFNSLNLDGYKIKPKNGINYDGIVVSSMTIINNDLVSILLKKKIKKKMDAYLQFLITVLDEDDTDAGHLMFALNDLDRYRHTIMNNYRVYLEKKYYKILMDKISLIEQELKSKIKIDIKNMGNFQMELPLEDKFEDKKGKSR